MKCISVGPLAHKKKSEILQKQIKYATISLFACFLPFIVIFVGLRMNANASGPYDMVRSIALLSNQSGSGSAILTGTSRLLTAAHVVENMKVGDVVQLNFQKAGQIQTAAKVIYIADVGKLSSEYDFAVLELLDKYALVNRINPIEIGNSSNSKLNERVIVVGYPSGGFSLTSGVISDDRASNKELFTVDAAAWAGNSGGALINEKNEDLIGLVIAVTTGDFAGRTLAIKLDFIVNSLKEQGIDLTQ